MRLKWLPASIVVIAVTAALPTTSAAPNEISSCGSSIVEPGKYVLTQDLTCSDTAIRITASGPVELDLGGFTIEGTTFGHGIELGGGSVVVAHGNIRGFVTGIGGQVSDATLNDLRVTEASEDGIAVRARKRIEVRNTTARDNGLHGMHFIGVHLSGEFTEVPLVIKDSATISNGTGIRTEIDPGIIKRVVSSANSGYGIALEDGGQIVDSQVTGNGESDVASGIFANGRLNVVERSVVSGNYHHGIESLGTRSVIDANRASHNGWGVVDGEGSGIFVTGKVSGENIARNNDGPNCLPRKIC
jgi:hypothetical protein